MISDNTADDRDLSSVPGSCWGDSGHRWHGRDKRQEQFADGNGPSFLRRVSLGTASMSKQPDPHTPRDVIMSSVCWCLPPSWGFYLPAALYSNPNMLRTMSCSMGKAPVILSLGRGLHVHAVLQDTWEGWEQGGTCSSETPNPLPSASSLADTAGL